MMLESGKEITQDRAESAAHWLAANAELIGECKGAVIKAEHMLKSVEALVFLASEGGAEMRKMCARNSEKYKDAVDQHIKAVTQYEVLIGKRRSAETLIDVWRSKNASTRGMM